MTRLKAAPNLPQVTRRWATNRLTGKGSLEGRSQLFICDLKLECQPPLPGDATIIGTRLPVEPVGSP